MSSLVSIGALVAGGLASSAVLVLRQGAPAKRRLDRVMSRPSEVVDIAPDARPAPVNPRWVRAACWAAGIGAVALVPTVVGLVAGLLLGFVGPIALARFEPRSVRHWRERAEHDLPLALDLFAACLGSGASFAAAANAVAEAVGGPLAHELRAVVVRLELGADPAPVWRTLGPGPRVHRVGVALARAVESGAASADVLASMADDQRAMTRREGEAAARRVAVRVAAPLGLCFLPAFVLLAVVPAVLGALAPVIRP